MSDRAKRYAKRIETKEARAKKEADELREFTEAFTEAWEAEERRLVLMGRPYYDMPKATAGNPGHGRSF